MPDETTTTPALEVAPTEPAPIDPGPPPATPSPPKSLEDLAKDVEGARAVYAAAKQKAADSLAQSRADAKSQNAAAQTLRQAIAVLEAAANADEPDEEPTVLA